MLTLVSATNRPNSRSRQILEIYRYKAIERGQPCEIIDLADVPSQVTDLGLYVKGDKPEAFSAMTTAFVKGRKFVFFVPEYNGSFPGILKLVIDALPFPQAFKGKKVALIGTGSGVQGAVLAMAHLTDIFHYLDAEVLAFKPKLNHIHLHLKEGKLDNPLFESMLDEHLERVIGWGN